MARVLEGKERLALFSLATDHFAIPRKAFEEVAFVDTGKKVRACSKKASRLVDFKFLQGIGMLFLDRKSNKISTEAIQLYGSKAMKNFVDLNEEEAKDFLSRKEVPIGEDRSKSLGKGYIIARYKGRTLALGKYNPEKKALKPAIPKEIAAVFW